MAVILTSACRLLAQDRALQCAEQNACSEMSVSLSISYGFCSAEHFRDCRRAPHVRRFPKFEVWTDRGRDVFTQFTGLSYTEQKDLKKIHDVKNKMYVRTRKIIEHACN